MLAWKKLEKKEIYLQFILMVGEILVKHFCKYIQIFLFWKLGLHFFIGAQIAQMGLATVIGNLGINKEIHLSIYN